MIYSALVLDNPKSFTLLQQQTVAVVSSINCLVFHFSWRWWWLCYPTSSKGWGGELDNWLQRLLIKKNSPSV